MSDPSLGCRELVSYHNGVIFKLKLIFYFHVSLALVILLELHAGKILIVEAYRSQILHDCVRTSLRRNRIEKLNETYDMRIMCKDPSVIVLGHACNAC